MSGFLRRYTELPFVLDYLRTKELTLLSPRTWDDKNDSYYVEAYAKAKNLAAVYVLCLTEANETYHHWKVFSSGSNGVCIVFKKESLIGWAKQIDCLRVAPVKYRTLKQCREALPELEDLPFLKRQAFEDELEFRLFATPSSVRSGPLRLKLPVSTIDRLMLNPWLPKSVADHVKATLKGVEGCRSLKVYRSTLVDNEAWKKFAAIEA
jgi:hypothetical protein